MSALAIFEVRLVADASDDALARYAEYKERVAPLILAAGGRYLARAAVGEFLEGDPADGIERRWHAIEFPSAEAARRFWASPEYAAIVALRDGAVDVSAVLLP